MHTLVTAFAIARDFLLDVVFPPEKAVALIERMSPSAFYGLAIKSDADLPTHTYSVFKYRTTLIRNALWALKYKGNTRIAHILATCLYDELRDTLLEEQIFNNFSDPILIPIPISPAKLKKRGWNQTELLAIELQKLDQNTTFTLSTSLFKKIRDTESQTKLNKHARIQNLKDSFAVPKEKESEIAGKNIILLDDIYTTGSTTKEAKDTLMRAGAKRVLVFTVAH